jgi:hypothetical protein
MQQPWWNIPASAEFQAVGAREVGDMVVALFPNFEAVPHLLRGRTWFQAHKRIGEVGPVVIHLRREVVGFRLVLLAHQLGVLLFLMQVVGKWPLVVKKLGIDRPATVLVPQCVTQQIGSKFGHGVEQRNLVHLAVMFPDHVAKAFIRGRERAVIGLGGRSKPALVDTAAHGAIGIEIAGVKLEALARDAERARHPGGGEAQYAFTLIQCIANHTACLLKTGAGGESVSPPAQFC